MRRIPLKTVEFTDPQGNRAVLNYGNNIIGLVKAPAEGANLAEMDIALAIEDAINSAQARGSEEVMLEEAQHAHLAALIRGTKFRWVTRELREFLADVTDAERFDANADPGRNVPRVGAVFPRASD